MFTCFEFITNPELYPNPPYTRSQLEMMADNPAMVRMAAEQMERMTPEQIAAQMGGAMPSTSQGAWLLVCVCVCVGCVCVCVGGGARAGGGGGGVSGGGGGVLKKKMKMWLFF